MGITSGFAKDFLLSAALVGVSFLLPGAAAFTWAAFAARTAIVLGVQTYSRQQQRRAARAAQRSPTDNMVTLRSVGHPDILPYGRCRVPTVLTARFAHGEGNSFNTVICTVPTTVKLTSIDRVLFDGVDIGEVDANGYVQPGSRFFTDAVASWSEEFDGDANGGPYTLLAGTDKIVAVDTVMVTDKAPVTMPDAVNPTQYRALTAGTDYTVSGNVVTMIAPVTSSMVVITYRHKSGGKAWVRVRRNLGDAAGGVYDVDGPLTGGGTTLSEATDGKWTAADKQCGRPNVVVTFEYDPSGAMWSTGLPQITLIVKGPALYDPTKDSNNGGSGAHRVNDAATWEWSDCAALVWRDYMRREVGCPPEEIDDASVRAAVSTCRTQVTKKGGGTEDAFTANGYLSTADDWQQNVETIAMSMIGNAVCVANVWSIVPFAWEAPVVTLPQSSTAEGDVTTDMRAGVDEIINCVRGKFLDIRATELSPTGAYVLTDFPQREITEYITQDLGAKYWHDIELPLTTSGEAAQRMATWYAYRARSAGTVQATFNIDAYPTAPGKRVRLPWAMQGWNFTQDGGTGKVWQILERRYTPPYKVALTLKEDAQAYYSWDYNVAKLLDPTPNTALPPPNYVASLRNVTATSDATTYYRRTDGTVVSYVRFAFDKPEQQDVVVVLEWKPANETVYRRVEGRAGDVELLAEGVSAGQVLNAVLTPYNALGAPGAPTWFPKLIVGAETRSANSVSAGNLLAHAALDRGVGPLTTRAVGLEASLVRVAKRTDTGYFIPGSPSSILLEIADTTYTGTGKAAAADWPRVSVQPGQRVVWYAGVIGWQTDAVTEVAFYDAAGAKIGASSYGTTIIGVPWEEPTRRFSKPEDYRPSWGFADAPAGTATAQFSAVGGGNWVAGGTGKYLSVTKPFFGLVPPGTNVLPPWNAGTVNIVDTPLIADGATEAVFTSRADSPRQITLNTSGYQTDMPMVVIPADADLEDGITLRVHVSIGLTVTGTAAAPTFKDVALVLGLNETNAVTEAGVTHYAGHLFDVHYSSNTSVNDVTLYGSTSWTLTIRHTKGVPKRFSLNLQFQPVGGNNAWWSIFMSTGSHITVEALKTLRT